MNVDPIRAGQDRQDLAAALHGLRKASGLSGERLARRCGMSVPEGAYHTFVVYDRRLVTIELFTGRLVLRDPRDIDHFRALYGFFSHRALWSDEARSILGRQAGAFRSVG